MTPRLTHICLHVESLDQCVQFYKRYCQMEVLDDRSENGEGSIYLSELGREKVMVLQFKSGDENATLSDNEERHFGFVVGSKKDVDDIARMGEEDGILFFEPDEYLPGAYICGVEDPNGNCVEFSFGHSVPPV